MHSLQRLMHWLVTAIQAYLDLRDVNTEICVKRDRFCNFVFLLNYPLLFEDC
jgi:hypothetical protein